MFFKHSIFTTTALSGLVLAQGVAAEITPDEVWAEMQAAMTDFGYVVTAAEARSGGDLLLSDIVIAMGDAGERFTVTLPELTLAGTGNGAVRVVVPTVTPLGISVAGDDTEEVDAVVTYTTDGFDVLISGAPKNLTYTFDVASLAIALDKLVVEDEEIGRDTIRVNLGLTDLKGESSQTTETLRQIAQEFTVGTFSFDIAGNDPEEGGQVMMKGGLSGLGFEGLSQMPLEFDPEDPVSMFIGGMTVDGTFTHEGGQTDFAVLDDGTSFSGKTASTGGGLSVAFSRERLLYDVTVDGLAIDASGSDIPLPISAKVAEAGFKIALPLGRTDEAAPVELDVTLAGFTMADLLWNLFDPGAVLPRDPATIRLDTSGALRLLVDLFDEKAMMAVAQTDSLPAEISHFDINDLTVEAAGARLSGQGSFTFDNSDTETFDGFPRPIGGVDLLLSGGYALLDKLVQLGFIPQEQAMGARMMVGMFAVPGGEPDTLTSKVQINDQAHILVNGQRVK